MSCGLKFLKKNRCIETSITRQTIVDQVSAFLHAGRIVKDSEEITDIDFGNLSKGDTLVPIKIFFKEGR